MKATNAATHRHAATGRRWTVLAAAACVATAGGFGCAQPSASQWAQTAPLIKSEPQHFNLSAVSLGARSEEEVAH